MLKHKNVWQAIDKLAEINGLSPSGLALKSGLSATVFNPSKRICPLTGRKRWPSTESVAMILQAVGATLGDFVALASNEAQPRTKLPMLSLTDARKGGSFDENGHPHGPRSDNVGVPGSKDPDAFVLEVDTDYFEPVYHEGDHLLLSPIEPLRHGDRVVARTQSGEVMIKLLGREGTHKVELMPLKSDDSPVTIARRDLDWVYRIIWANQ